MLEPSCGDGSFLQPATEHLLDLGPSGPSIADQLKGIEIVSDEEQKARARLSSKLGSLAPQAHRTRTDPQLSGRWAHPILVAPEDGHAELGVDPHKRGCYLHST